MNCPWDFLPAVPSSFCENALCSWIREPSNTWSNLIYFIIGTYLWWRARKEGYRPLVWIGIVAILTGFGSFFYHMSGTYIGGCADYLGMFLGTGILTAYNSRRLFNCSFRKMYFIFAATTLAFFALLHFRPEDSRSLYGFGMPCCVLELILFIRDKKEIRYASYIMSSLLVSIAAIFWWLDVTKRLCHPDNHFVTGHAMWHVLTACAFIPLYQYYKQFPELKGKLT